MDSNSLDAMYNTPLSPSHLPSPPRSSTEITTNMVPRNSLAPDSSSTVVNWHGINAICPSRWSMLPDRWNTVNSECVADLKAMISDAFAFRAIVDEPDFHVDKPAHTRAAADALRTLLMNPLFHTLHSDIFKNDVRQSPRTKVTDWRHKRQSELGKFIPPPAIMP